MLVGGFFTNPAFSARRGWGTIAEVGVTPPAEGSVHPPHNRGAARSRSGSPVRRASPPELDHRVANSLQLAVDFLLFQQARLADPVPRRALIEAAERLVAVGHLHRFLCAHDGDQAVDLKPFLEALAALIAQGTGLKCSTEVEPLRVTGAVAQQLGLMVNELAINAAKHAYPMGEPGELSIEAFREGEELRLTVADRGVGLPAGFDTAAAGGLGLDILRRIASQLHGSLQAQTDGGARFTLSAPLPSAGPLVRSFARPA
jgi:two-component sensor histidine kinase